MAANECLASMLHEGVQMQQQATQYMRVTIIVALLLMSVSSLVNICKLVMLDVVTVENLFCF